jgi:hypothetical protein
MAVVFCWFAIILLVVCAVLQFTRKRALGCWLLALFPAILCGATLFDLSHGQKNLGTASYNTDLRTLPYVLILLGVTVLAALRPRWIWPFWIVWILNALICGVAVFLTFFWKVFS